MRYTVRGRRDWILIVLNSNKHITIAFKPEPYAKLCNTAVKGYIRVFRRQNYPQVGRIKFEGYLELFYIRWNGLMGLFNLDPVRKLSPLRALKF